MPGSVSRKSPTALATVPDSALAGAAAAAGALAAGAAAVSPPPPTSNTTSTSPTGTVSPTLKRRSATLPVLGAPMVTVALSVITSTISWFSLTLSPSLTSQLTISPSATPSPMSGSLNSNFDIRDSLSFRGRPRSSPGYVEQGRQNPVGKRHRLHLESVRERRIEARYPHRSRFQVIKRAFDDQGHQLRPEAERARRFVDDHEAAGALHAVENGVHVHGPQSAKVDGFGVDAF